MRTVGLVLMLFLCLPGCAASGVGLPAVPESNDAVSLPAPSLTGSMSVEEALASRRSVRQYSGEPLTLCEVSQLLWAAQGTTAPWGGRTAPSAGALYPLEVLLLAGEVQGLDVGLYRYESDEHDLALIRHEDVRTGLASAALGQSSIREGAIVVVISGVYERTTDKYGERGVRYVHMEAGHAAQNVCLESTALGLGNVVIGSFDDDEVSELLGLAPEETPLYIIPVGGIEKGSG